MQKITFSAFSTFSTSPAQVTWWNIQNHAPKMHVPSLSKNCTVHENIEPESKSMIENLQGKLHQEEWKQSKVAKTRVSIKWELDCEKCSRTFREIFGRQNMQSEINTNIPVTLMTFLNQLKPF